MNVGEYKGDNDINCPHTRLEMSWKLAETCCLLGLNEKKHQIKHTVKMIAINYSSLIIKIYKSLYGFHKLFLPNTKFF